MSKVIRSWYPHCSAVQTAPVTPPAGPDSSMVTGAAIAASADCRPPSLRRMDSSPPTPLSPSCAASESTYRLTWGWT